MRCIAPNDGLSRNYSSTEIMHQIMAFSTGTSMHLVADGENEVFPDLLLAILTLNI